MELHQYFVIKLESKEKVPRNNQPFATFYANKFVNSLNYPIDFTKIFA